MRFATSTRFDHDMHDMGRLQENEKYSFRVIPRTFSSHIEANRGLRGGYSAMKSPSHQIF